MAVDRIAYAKSRYSVLEYARDILGLPVRKSGDRCVSLAPDSHNPTAMIIFDNWWYDYKQGCGGDVIDLCAEAKYGGDKGAAIHELAGDYGINYDWRDYTQKLGDKITFFHSQLREADMHYLYRRGIKKETVDRLMLSYDASEDRLIIPYWKNGYVAYYVGRDRSGQASKYKKAKLDGFNENIAWGLHSFEPKHREWAKKMLTEQYTESGLGIASNASESSTPLVAENVKKIKKRNFESALKILEKYTVISEGAFDIMSFEQEGFKVLSPISGYFNKDTLKQVMNIVQSQDCVFVCFDSDKAGSRFQIEMCKHLFKHRVNFVCGVLPGGYKDISEYYADGKDLFELIENAESGISMLAERITDKDEFKKFVYDAARFVDEPELTELFENVSQFSSRWLSAVLKKALKPPIEDIIAKEILEKRRLKYVEGLGFYEYGHGVWIKRSDNLVRGYFSDLLGHWLQAINSTRF